MEEKIVCPNPKCGQFMLLRYVDGSQHIRQWECPWCGNIEKIDIKPKDHISENGTPEPGSMWDCQMGVNGKCQIKDFDIYDDNTWKCVDFRIKTQVTRKEYEEFNTHQKYHWFINVCRWCRYFIPKQEKK